MAGTTLTKPDPFSQVLAFLWAKLEAHTAFAAMVDAGNRIKYLGTSITPEKEDMMAPGDFPQVRIIPAGGEVNLHRDASDAIVVQAFAIEALTCEERVGVVAGAVDLNVLFALQTYMLDALHGAQDLGITEDVTNYSWKLERLEVGLGGIDRETEFMGWQILITVDATIKFARSGLC